MSDPDGWIINNITFYAYQSGSTTTSTITAVNYRIWNGTPGIPAIEARLAVKPSRVISSVPRSG